MRRAAPHLLAAVAAMLLAACDLAESEACPAGVLEVRSFEGPPVTENLLECTRGLTCTLGQGIDLFSGVLEGCNRVVLRFGLRSFAHAHYFDIFLDPDSRVATAWYVQASDVGEPRLYPVRGGWIALEQWDDDVVVGRFEIEVAGGGLARGDFDTRIEPFD